MLVDHRTPEPDDGYILRVARSIEELPEPSRRNISRLYLDQDGRCFYCGRGMYLVPEQIKWNARMRTCPYLATIDHVKPVSTNGRDSALDNLVAACLGCNEAKGAMPLSLFLWKIDRKPLPWR